MKNPIFYLSMLCLAILLASCQNDKLLTPTTDSEEAKTLFLEALELKANAEVYSANEKLNLAIELDADLAVAYAWLGTPEDVAKAMTYLDQVSEAEQHFIKFCDAYLKLDKKAQEEELKALEALVPDDPWPAFALGTVHPFNPEYFNQSEMYLKKALEIDSSYGPAHNIISYLYMSWDRPELAEKHLIKYIDLEPQLSNAYDSYGEFLVSQERFDEAIPQFEQAYMLNPDWTMAFAKMGHAYVYQKQFEKAREYFDKTIALDEKMITVKRYKAASYIAEGNPEQAIDELQELILDYDKINNYIGHGNSLINIMLIHMFVMQTDQMVPYAQAALDYYLEKQAEVRNGEQYVFFGETWKALAYAYDNQFDEAYAQLEMTKRKLSSLTNSEYNTQFWYAIAAFVEMQAGNFDKAVKLYETKPMENPLAHFGRAWAYDENGQTDEAIKFYKKLKVNRYYDLNLAVVRNQAMARLSQLE